jgi:hypothetical protein
LLICGLWACGPSQPPPRRAASGGGGGGDGANQNTGETPRPRDEGLEVKGLLGTIDAAAVEKAFNAKASQVGTCRSTHTRGLPYVGGIVRFFFRIGTDGVPTAVRIERSQLGHHAYEECLLTVAKSLTFVRPKGGSAEVRYDMELTGGGTAAVEWSKAKVKSKIRAKRASLAACRKGGKPGSFTITFFVLPGGAAKTAGVASTEDLPAGFGACVAKVITSTTFPDPLGQVARVTYDW